jgi:hypothetical protein
MTLAKQAAKLLAGLGDTPEEIRAMLVGAGYKGRRYNYYECPCGACLREHLGSPINVSRESCHDLDGNYRPHTKAVKQFTYNFDEGLYPELIAE